ncbi:hypothetical protein L195_g002407 [Trifolium pratense]|uniref:Uncharacterized protein n=1 Tax=Trifolium pratense TaxID=57577 RepID=A0A2K3NSF0_TRIPR|nr:hypothetical protein L195_g002407 [Trifolium pratense]
MLTKVNALQANRAESLPSVSIRVASLFRSVKGELAAYLLYPRVLARLVLRALLLPSPSPRSFYRPKAVWSIAKWGSGWLIAVPEPSPGGMHGSLALHGTGVRSPPPSNLTLPRSPYEFELRSPGAKRF